MRLRSLLRLLPLATLSTATLLAAACGDDGGTTTSGATGGGGAGGAGGATTATTSAGGAGGAMPDPTAICGDLGLASRPFEEGSTGIYRGELAADFTVPLVDGTSFNLKEGFSGCETYLFIPDRIAVSALDDTSIWEKPDLDDLIAKSPRNTHYFFVSRQAAVDAAAASATAMNDRVNALLATLPPEDAEHWKTHLHVVAGRAADLEGWPKDVLSSHGVLGFGIDRWQRIRGLGYLADVKRFSSQLNNAGEWPWKNNLAYAANETRYWNAQFDRLAPLETDGATIVTVHDGEILAEFQESDVMLPSAAEMAAFDTFEIEIEQACPDQTKIEFGNCGAWDYLAYLFVKDEADQNVELARFITAYHRETHWRVDVSQMLPLLKEGGMRRFRWEFAPPWNTQPTATKLKLRFSNRGKAEKPAETTKLFTGGAFGAAYNATRLPVDVPIPADAKKVELWTLVTGHGAATNQCAEFCDHEHELTVNGTPYLKSHPEAGTNEGCVEQLENGMVPNQPGTWWFGRGGWCPGQQVEPWVVDVTADVTPGQPATVSYRGLFNGMDPPEGSGDIVFTSYLVVHR